MFKKIRMFLIIVTILFLFVPSVSADISNQDGFSPDLDLISEEARGKVISATEPIIMEEMMEYGYTTKVQQVKVQITTGKFKGKVIDLENICAESFIYNLTVEQGEEVLITIETDESGNYLNAYITDHVRDKYIVLLTVLFFALIILLAKFKGLKTVLTLIFTVLMIGKFLLPLILKGYNPVILSIIVSAVVTAVTLVAVGGINVKTTSAIAGTIGGIVTAGILAHLVGNWAKLTGLSGEEAQMLLFIPQQISLDFKGILFAGIIIGTLGAVMDVSISIASSMDEVRKINPDIKTYHLFEAGMNVGRDVMGTMSNTLVLAYTGSALPLLLLFMAHKTSISKVVNLDLIATEIIRALTGSIGLILTIPITAGVFSYLIKIRKDNLKDSA